jgi:hypothetical protein
VASEASRVGGVFCLHQKKAPTRPAFALLRPATTPNGGGMKVNTDRTLELAHSTLMLHESQSTQVTT